MYIGLTGTNAAGKTTVLKYLVAKGYPQYSLSDILREELNQEKQPVTRENLINKGNALRMQHGPGILAARILKKLRTDFAVIDSIRNPAEIETLRGLNRFLLIAVDAPVELRFQRAQARKREENAADLAAFIEMENRERSSNPLFQNIRACIERADFCVENNQTENALLATVEEILARAQQKFRPSWDEYFMKMAFLVAERSTCLRHHVGAIIMKEKQVLTTGYNGAARNTRDCLQLGCLRDELKIPSGERHEICRGIHAEQNAIIQAARHGININGGTIYCTHSPCIICAKMIVNAGIQRIVVGGDYPDILGMAQQLYTEVGMQYDRIPIPTMAINVLK
jgi:dCMP deaminase